MSSKKGKGDASTAGSLTAPLRRRTVHVTVSPAALWDAESQASRRPALGGGEEKGHRAIKKEQEVKYRGERRDGLPIEPGLLGPPIPTRAARVRR